ncbi:GDP-mannose 4,6-dehydratase [Rhabdaerophilum sp. SD176]|uniref:GDP-mannose 4,6-dehydratase n=1 Tax=Rhabdaerophilum sp. SD176 TaxID=2983548 RepID=UPI0024DF96DA|nr:GDP-mannose 4,6-dehydratase [Rhabdaerophilum sp. SD176]
MRSTVITGVTGQDGAYLASLMLERGYRVFGTFRRTSSVNLWRLRELGIDTHPHLVLTEYDLTDPGAAIRLLDRAQPEHVFNLAAQSFVGVSFEQPVATAQMTGVGPLLLLEAIRTVNPKIRFYQASTSELYGLVQEVPQSETTPFYPRSPYAVAKLFAHWSTINYREAYGLFGACGILFNHESPLRGREFVTRKITNAAAQVKLGMLDRLELGNLDAKRDWGFAADYVEGMVRIIEHDTPDTFVLATGQTTAVRDFVTMAFHKAGIDLAFEGQGLDEIGRCGKTGTVRVAVNPHFFRPAEVDLLIGDPTRAKEQLGWAATTSLDDLCTLMVEADLKRNQDGWSF